MNVAPTLDYLLIERVLLGNLPIDQLDSAGKDFCQKYKPVFDVGRLAFRMAQGYYAHTAAIEVARGPHARALVSETPLGEIASYIIRKDGTQHTFDLPYYLGQAHTHPGIVDELPRVWLVGSLLAVGDVISRGCYALCIKSAARASMRQTNATKCRPARVEAPANLMGCCVRNCVAAASRGNY